MTDRRQEEPPVLFHEEDDNVDECGERDHGSYAPPSQSDRWLELDHRHSTNVNTALPYLYRYRP